MTDKHMITKKKVSKKVEPMNPESMVCPECEIKVTPKGVTEDEKEVNQLRYLLNEMERRGIHDCGTLAVILARKEKELKSH
jgi:DNA-directed RNA polymerase subunit RPC12/RpoP